MKSFIPKTFLPNRQRKSVSLPAVPLRQHVAELQAALQDAARRNLNAVLSGAPPLALEAGPFERLLDAPGEDPLAGYALADWRAGTLPDQPFAMRLMHEPGRSAAIAMPQSGLGSELIMPRLLHMALGNGAFRHDLAEDCRRFLCERVLFHPGPPPQALFSPAALAQLCLSQTGHLGLLSGRARAALQGAAAFLQAEGGEPTRWDQWLFRCMEAATGWQLAERLAALPWVAWRSGDPAPDLPAGAQVPEYWLSLIDLDL